MTRPRKRPRWSRAKLDWSPEWRAAFDPLAPEARETYTPPPRPRKTVRPPAPRQSRLDVAIARFVSGAQRWRLPLAGGDQCVRDALAIRLARWEILREPCAFAENVSLEGAPPGVAGAADFLEPELGLAVVVRLGGSQRETHRRIRCCALDPRVEHVVALVARPLDALPPVGARHVTSTVIDLQAHLREGG